MATRMQQRRGTASQWTSADPILAAGEIGFETDTGEFRVGDGINNWSDLSPFKNLEDLGGSLDDYVPLTEKGVALGVATLDADGKVPYTQIPNIDELSQDAVDSALVAGTGISKTYNDPGNTITVSVDSTIATKSYADTAVSDHNSDTTSVHGIADTAALATKTYADDAVATHNSDTTSVHGIADTSELLTSSDADTAYVRFEPSVTQVIKGTTRFEPLVAGGKPLTVKGVSSQTANLTEWKDSSDNVLASVDAAGNILTEGNLDVTGDVTVSGNLTVQGTTTTENTTSIEVEDPLIYIGSGNTGNTLDLGFVAHFDDGTYQHTGFVRDSSEDKWKLFSGVVTEPGATVDFSGATYDTLQVGMLEGDVTGNVTGDVSGNAGTVTDGVYTTDTGTVTNTMLAGSIANSKLSNNSITLGSTTIALGETKGTESVVLNDLNINDPTIIGGLISRATLKNIVELTTVQASSATGTINYDVAYSNDTYYTANASGNFTLNFRSFDGQTLNTAMTTGTTMTRVFRNTNGSTAYYPNVIQIDGTTITPKWLGGTAPAAGNPNAVDVYTFVITKTANATFAVFASASKFA